MFADRLSIMQKRHRIIVRGNYYINARRRDECTDDKKGSIIKRRPRAAITRMVAHTY